MEEILAGTTDRTILVFIPDSTSTTGAGKTGLAHTAITVSYTRVETDNDVINTDVTSSLNALSALTDAHNDWGWKEVSSTLSPGLYRLDVADAVFATGAWYGIVQVTVTTGLAAATPKAFKLVDWNPETLGTRIPAATTVTNLNTIFNTDYATVYDTTNKAFLAKLGNFAMGGSSLALTTGAIACTTITASGAVAFQSTFAVTTSTSLGALSCTTLTASGAVAFQSTFAVTTSTALAALSCTTLTASGAVALQSTFAITGTTTLTGAVTASNASNNIVGIDVAKISGDATAADNLELFFDGTGYNAANSTVGTVTLVSTLTTYTGNTPQTGDSFALIGATGSGLTSLATQASVNTIDDFLDTEIAAIKAKTDQLVFTVANTLNVNVQYVNDVQVNGDGQPGTEWGP